MARQKRRTFSAEFKFETVLETLKGEKRAAQICREREINENLLSRWKQEFVQAGAELFRRGEQSSAATDELNTRIAELERMVGKLTMQLEISKKASAIWGWDSRRNGQ